MTTLAERPHSEQDARRAVRPLVILEGIVLLLAAPLLLFPDIVPVATAVALAALAAIWLGGLALDRSTLPPTPFNLALLFLGLAIAVGILVSADPSETLPKATGLILGLATWRWLVIAVRTRRHVDWALALLLAICFGFSFAGIVVFGLVNLPKIPLLTSLNPFQGLVLPEWLAVAVHPNQLAGLICLYLPLLVSLLFAPRRYPAWLRPVLAGLTALAVFAHLLTQSRGGWIGATAGLLVLLGLWAAVLPPSKGRRALRWLAVAGCVAVLGIILWIGPANLRDIWLNPPAQTAVGTLTTLSYRRVLWPWAVTAIGDFPFTGIGLGAFRQAAFRLYPLPLPVEQDIAHAHNIFLQTGLDLGLPGLVAYGAVLILAAVVGWRVARRDVGLRAVSLGLLAGLAALHIFGLADALALGAKPGLVFWFALGLLAAMNKEGLES